MQRPLRSKKGARGTVHWLRWGLPASFLVAAGAGAWLAFEYKSDPTWLQIWLGVALTFLTAGLVDLVALMDTRRRALMAEARMAPIAGLVTDRLVEQQRDIVRLVRVVFGAEIPSDVQLEPLARQLRAWSTRVTVSGTDDTLYPPLPQVARIRQLYQELQERQRLLEILASSGLQGPTVGTLSELLSTSTFILTANAMWSVSSVGGSIANATWKDANLQAADMVDRLRELGIDDTPDLREMDIPDEDPS